MSKGRHMFRRTDLMRAVQAVKDTGLSIGEARITPDGSISIVTTQPQARPANELDAWIAKDANSAERH